MEPVGSVIINIVEFPAGRIRQGKNENWEGKTKTVQVFSSHTWLVSILIVQINSSLQTVLLGSTVL